MPDAADGLKVQMAFACESLAQDQFQRPSFHTVIDTLTAAQYPASTGIINFVFGFFSSEAFVMTSCSVRVVGTEGSEQIFNNAVPDVSFTPERPSARIFTGVQGIVWPRPDLYHVQFRQGENIMASFQLRLTSATVTVPQP